MDLVYLWIEHYKNIQNQGFNFGSEFIYTTKVEKDIIKLERVSNDKFISDFFKANDGIGLENISAIVGENASGKSNFLDALRRILTGEGSVVFSYLLIYTYKEGDEIRTYILNNTKNEHKAKFKEDNHKGGLFSKLIFYSPTVDFSIYPVTHDTSIGIDVSSDWLLYDDYNNQHNSIEGLNAMEHFKFQDCLRQIRLSEDEVFKKNIKSKINIPNRIRFETKIMDFTSEISNMSDARNVPYIYRDYYNLLCKEKIDIVNKYASEEHAAQVKFGDNSKQFIEAQNKKCFAFFLIHLVTNIYYHLDSTNHYLSKGKISISIEELKTLQLEEAVIEFFAHQDLVEFDPILNLIKSIEYLIFNGNIEFVDYSNCSWNTSIELFSNFLDCYDAYLKSLEKFVTYKKPNGFIDVDWSGMSTGEKVYFNLYSRIYDAKLKIASNSKEKFTGKLVPIPNVIYLLIDEGELGFHLQWQKDYINELISILPSILFFKNDKGEIIKPKIHLFFTTHSPISLSDIPNYNIVYVKKNGKNSMKVLDENERPDQSFGANVHNLMTNSFYLSDGLVGKFAVSKINEVIALIRKEEISHEEKTLIQKMISIIDEPTLRMKLQLMFEQKHLKRTELEILEEQKRALEIKIRDIKLKTVLGDD
jgi:hypothetical protein